MKTITDSIVDSKSFVSLTTKGGQRDYIVGYTTQYATAECTQGRAAVILDFPAASDNQIRKVVQTICRTDPTFKVSNFFIAPNLHGNPTLYIQNDRVALLFAGVCYGILLGRGVIKSMAKVISNTPSPDDMY